MHKNTIYVHCQIQTKMQSRKLVLQQKLVLQRKLVLQQKLVPRQIVLSNPHLQMYPITMTILVVIGFFIPWLFKMVLATNIYTINMHELWNFLHEHVHSWFLWTFSNFVIHVHTVYRDDMHYQGNVVELMRDDFLFCFCQYLEVERTGKWHKACSATYCKKMLFWCSEACVNSPWNLWLMDHQIQSMISDHKYFLYSNSESI